MITGENEGYRHVGTVTLRAKHDIYEGPDDYLVVSGTRRNTDRKYGRPVSSAAVDTCLNALRPGGSAIEDIASQIAINSASRLGFGYSRDWQLRYEVERALLVLVALGRAVVIQEGRGFRFLSQE